MIKIKNIFIVLFISLSFTGIYFFKLGLAKFTVFHLLAVLVTVLLFLMSLRKKKLIIKVPRYYGLAAVFLLIVNISYLESIKVTSFIFSLIMLLELLLVYNIVRMLSTLEIIRIIKSIILLYFIDLTVASVFLLVNFKPTGVLESIFQIYDFDGRIRPYGFSDEPSYAAIILVFSLFVLLKGSGFTYQKREFPWYVIACVGILLTRSSYGYMLLAIVLFYFTLNSRVIFIHLTNIVRERIMSLRGILITGLVIFGLLVLLLSNLDIKYFTSLNRLVTISQSFVDPGNYPSEGLKSLAYTDGSASMRVLPTLYLAEDFSDSPWRFVLFGRGAGSAIPFFSKIYEGNMTLLGFIPCFVYNYGLLGTWLFLLMFLSLFPKKKLLLFVLFVLFIFNADFNTQIFLYILFAVSASRQIELNAIPADSPEEYA